MNKLQQERILLNASILYGCFPAPQPYNNNQLAVIWACKAVQKVEEYRDAEAFGIPLGMRMKKYDEIWEMLQKHEEKLERTAPAFREAQKALGDLERFMNWIFCRS